MSSGPCGGVCCSNDVVWYRLQKQKKKSEEQKYLEKLRMEEKLAALAAERQRTSNLLTYKDATLKPRGSGSVADNDGGSRSECSKAKSASQGTKTRNSRRSASMPDAANTDVEVRHIPLLSSVLITLWK